MDFTVFLIHHSRDGWHATSMWCPGLVWLQNTAQQLLQITMHIVLLFWIKTDLRSDLRALNLEKFSRRKCSQTSLDYAWLRTNSLFSPLTSMATGLKCEQVHSKQRRSQKKLLLRA